ncbi:hypothetical protein Q8791_23485 [Nocardiopsis sp. CT-R113]|uniref:Uncharacterized protein n=1 Tax=Nocardiopsis codii TaxID=3065942 RepID=A0ABU7KE42_9ACTN|nr:hypothetical protein [Nocardiopsis sp. CT-R113]MEE2040184.1 hypothetical protein [Nocardiopsis sp. CT-R113]
MATEGYMSEFQGRLRSAGSAEELADLLGDTGGETPSTVAWSAVTGKPSTFPPTIGTTASTAAAGNHTHANLATADALSALAARVQALEDAAS